MSSQDVSVQAIRNYVRSFVDVDSTDIADAMCDSWTYEGFFDLVGSDVRWPFYEVGENADGTAGSTNPGTDYYITTTVGVQNYKLPSFAVQGINATVNNHRIVSLTGPHWELLYASQTALQETFTKAFIVSQEPERYSLWGTTGVTLWPIPNSAYRIDIRAYRDPVDWISLGAGGLIDAPNDFFTVLQNYVLSCAWAQQTDLQQASYWMQTYEAGKARLYKKYLRAPLNDNAVLNGGQVTRELPPRLRFPFEGLNQIGIGR